LLSAYRRDDGYEGEPCLATVEQARIELTEAPA
jgi:hypothetical protein